MPRRADDGPRAAEAMIRRLASVAAGLAMAACASAPAPVPLTPRGATGPEVRMSTFASGETFTPAIGDAAARAFKAEIAAVDRGGECGVYHSPGSTATTITAAFPSRAEKIMSVALTFDSAGHLAKYSEQRGADVFFKMPPNATRAQQDSVVRASANAVRQTVISLDYAEDRGMISNRGAGRPTEAVLASVKTIESLPSLGPLTERLARVRKLCGT